MKSPPNTQSRLSNLHMISFRELFFGSGYRNCLYHLLTPCNSTVTLVKISPRGAHALRVSSNTFSRIPNADDAVADKTQPMGFGYRPAYGRLPATFSGGGWGSTTLRVAFVSPRGLPGFDIGSGHAVTINVRPSFPTLQNRV